MHLKMGSPEIVEEPILNCESTKASELCLVSHTLRNRVSYVDRLHRWFGKQRKHYGSDDIPTGKVGTRKAPVGR